VSVNRLGRLGIHISAANCLELSARAVYFVFVLCILCSSMYSISSLYSECLCVNVYCTAATGCQPNCS
jgi:hypothetical protein